MGHSDTVQIKKETDGDVETEQKMRDSERDWVYLGGIYYFCICQNCPCVCVQEREVFCFPSIFDFNINVRGSQIECNGILLFSVLSLLLDGLVFFLQIEKTLKYENFKLIY